MATTRLYALLARKAPVAVIFRRGPSKQVALVHWDLARDRFTVGQWLKGRIYERRCDLSPSGDRLIYFAARWKGPHQSWTAVSRPPWLTALTLWPKGDAWGGGGLFPSENLIGLNHPRHQFVVDGREPPKRVKVEQYVGRGGGEDFPIWQTRLELDGWRPTNDGSRIEHPYGETKIWIEYDPPMTFARPSPRKGGPMLEMRIRGIKERDGAWWVTDYAVVAGDEAQVLRNCDWADWDRHGDLLFARDGKVFRASHRTVGGDLSRAKELIDLSGLKFTERVSPPEARRW